MTTEPNTSMNSDQRRFLPTGDTGSVSDRTVAEGVCALKTFDGDWVECPPDICEVPTHRHCSSCGRRFSHTAEPWVRLCIDCYGRAIARQRRVPS